MRITAGTARGRRIATLPGEDTRPTLARVKEGMFSAVQFWLPGAAVLDLFAGSGQLGLEALSRGAKSCVFVDENPAAVKLVHQNLQNAGLAEAGRVLRSGADAYLAHCRDVFDLVLLDPPYAAGHFPGLLKKVAPVCGPGALVICESAPDVDFPDVAESLFLEKQYRYGTVLVSRYKKEE